MSAKSRIAISTNDTSLLSPAGGSLRPGELAYNEADNALFIGRSDGEIAVPIEVKNPPADGFEYVRKGSRWSQFVPPQGVSAFRGLSFSIGPGRNFERLEDFATYFNEHGYYDYGGSKVNVSLNLTDMPMLYSQCSILVPPGLELQITTNPGDPIPRTGMNSQGEIRFFGGGKIKFVTVGINGHLRFDNVEVEFAQQSAMWPNDFSSCNLHMQRTTAYTTFTNVLRVRDCYLDDQSYFKPYAYEGGDLTLRDDSSFRCNNIEAMGFVDSTHGTLIINSDDQSDGYIDEINADELSRVHSDQYLKVGALYLVRSEMFGHTLDLFGDEAAGTTGFISLVDSSLKCWKIQGTVNRLNSGVMKLGSCSTLTVRQPLDVQHVAGEVSANVIDIPTSSYGCTVNASFIYYTSFSAICDEAVQRKRDYRGNAVYSQSLPTP